jgi:hypothetical protein
MKRRLPSGGYSTSKNLRAISGCILRRNGHEVLRVNPLDMMEMKISDRRGYQFRAVA